MLAKGRLRSQPTRLISADRANALWCVALDHKAERDARPIQLVREATLAHACEALGTRIAFQNLRPYSQDSVIEFLKSLQILPAGTKCTLVDENMNCAHSSEMSP